MQGIVSTDGQFLLMCESQSGTESMRNAVSVIFLPFIDYIVAVGSAAGCIVGSNLNTLDFCWIHVVSQSVNQSDGQWIVFVERLGIL